jgi:hypothetical protein
MRLWQWVAVFSVTALTCSSGGLGASAQATLSAEIRNGACDIEITDTVLTDLTVGTGETVGPFDAIPAASSFSVVPWSVEILAGADHALLVSDASGAPLACGKVGGPLTDSGSLIFGLSPVEDSGVSGIAVMSPAADPSQVNLSVFVAPVPEGDTAAAQLSDSEQAANPLAVIGEGQAAASVEAQQAESSASPSFASGGLGLSVAAWQKEHGPGTPNSFGMHYNDGEYWTVSGDDGKLVHIEQEIQPQSLEDARTLSKTLMPADAQLVGSYVAEFGLPVELYFSPSLIAQLPGENWTGGEPGNFIVIYGQYGPPEGTGPVTDLLVATGNNP